VRDYITIGPSPSDEDCAQVGQPDYVTRSKKECRAFLNQLVRVFGEPPDGASLAVKQFDHEFGTYREVVCCYDDNIRESVDYAFKCEGEAPARWDDEARKELGLIAVTPQ